MNVLVTGGAGYVGSIVAEELIKDGHEVIVMDNLAHGHRNAVLPEAQFILGDSGNPNDLNEVFGRFDIDAVMHMAALTLVGPSMTDPRSYFHNNIIGGIRLLDSMLEHNIKDFIFSSSAAVYGEPIEIPIQEDHPKVPANSYGETKLMFEKVLYWYGQAYGIRYISLRYFCAAGASSMLGEDHRPETHLIPNVLRAALDKNKPVHIFGTDYPTKDGSCIRDFVHVIDIAQAHRKALYKIEDLNGRAYNLGSGDGYSVMEVIETAENVCRKQIPKIISTRRTGDPAILLASSDQARRELGWAPKFSEIKSIVQNAWDWMVKNPTGYAK